jgi:hypothetical protein
MSHNYCTILATGVAAFVLLVAPVLSPDFPNWTAMVIGRIIVHIPAPVEAAARVALSAAFDALLGLIRIIAWSLPFIAGSLLVGIVSLWVWLQAANGPTAKKEATGSLQKNKIGGRPNVT